MSRDVQIEETNTLTLYDPIEKTSVVFTHRSPDTNDRVRYMTGRYKRAGTQLVDRTKSALIDAACEVLTGIREEDFTNGKDADGKAIPLSSDPESPFFNKNWKKLVKNVAGDLLFLMGHQLFEGKLSIDAIKDINIVSEFDVPIATDLEIAEPIPPLANSSVD